MLDEYRRSLQMISYLGIKLTKKQYNQLAKKHNLLSAMSMQYISECNFQYLVKHNIK